jgi:hypothetical protein
MKKAERPFKHKVPGKLNPPLQLTRIKFHLSSRPRSPQLLIRTIWGDIAYHSFRSVRVPGLRAWARTPQLFGGRNAMSMNLRVTQQPNRSDAIKEIDTVAIGTSATFDSKKTHNITTLGTSGKARSRGCCAQQGQSFARIITLEAASCDSTSRAYPESRPICRATRGQPGQHRPYPAPRRSFSCSCHRMSDGTSYV